MRAIYIHIPFCRSRCNYCTFSSSCDYGKVDEYIDALCDNIVEDDSMIDSIFIGGGTPSTLGTVHFDQIFDTIYSRHRVAGDCEITVECNPDSITAELIDCLVSHGVNRISLGLQSSNDDTLAVIGRRHSYADFLEALAVVRLHGISNINVDIMVGLPESYQSFANTVATVASLDIAHISMYALELYPSSKLHGMVSSGQCMAVADDDMQAQWYDSGMVILETNGFGRYEVSNFAKSGRECRHNLHYWRCDEYYGYGLSAHGYIDNIRYSCTDDMSSYIAGNIANTSEFIDNESAMQEYIMLGLRLDSGVSISQFYAKFGVSLMNKYPSILPLLEAGQLHISGDMLYVPTSFTYVLTAILAEIL